MHPTYAEQLREWLLRPMLLEQQAALHELRKLVLMAQVSQADLNDIAAGLVNTEGLLEQALVTLQNQNPDLDLSGVRAAAASLAALVPSDTGGGTPPVSDDPDAPVVDGSGDGDGSSDGGDDSGY